MSLKKLWRKLLELLGLRKPKKPEPKPQKPAPKQPAPKKPKPEEPKNESPKHEDEEHKKRYGDPKKSDQSAEVETFLWKPKSDHAPHFPVIVVATDKMRNDELKCRIKNKNGKVIDTMSGSPTGRANSLPGYKFGRIHFRPNRSAKQMKRSAPLEVEFFLKIGDQEIPVKVRGKKAMKVNNPERRKDLK